jgi:anti-anti-sigma factor
VTALSLTTKVVGEVCFAGIAGPMTLSALLPKISNELSEMFVRTNRLTGMVIDLSEVTDIDSAGLGELVNIYKVMSDHHVNLALTGLDRRTREMLSSTRLDQLLPCFESSQEAEASVRSGHLAQPPP